MTYSLIARDPSTGLMGVVTQSQAHAVGSSVPWAVAGAGVVATQSMGEPMYGALGTDSLRAGLTAEEALRALRSVDPQPERRQVGMADAAGRFAVYTGDACVRFAGHAVGDTCAGMGNMVAGPAVWEAMVESYESGTDGLPSRGGDWFPERLVRALAAGEAAGGDRRGQRSAAVVVVRAEQSGRPWRDQLVDLRVDSSPDAVADLVAMASHTRRYHQTVEAFEHALDGRPDAALEALPEPVGASGEDAGSDPDLALWRGIVLACAGDEAGARRLGEELAARSPAFVPVARDFVPAGLVDAAVLETVLGPED